MDWVTIARIVRPHGVHGEMLAELETDFPERFAGLERLFLSLPGRTPQPFSLLAQRPQGERILLSLEGIESPEAAAPWRGADVCLPLCERRAAPAGAYFLADLEGCELWDGERWLGRVERAESGTQSAPLLYVAAPAGETLLVPFVAAYLRRVDLATKRIEMKLPEGLLEINRVGRK